MQAGICSFFRTELTQVVCSTGKTGKEQKHKLLLLPAQKASQFDVFESLSYCGVDQCRSQAGAQVSCWLVCSAQPVFSFLILGVLQSEVLRFILPLEGSHVHVFFLGVFFFCIRE